MSNSREKVWKAGRVLSRTAALFLSGSPEGSEMSEVRR